MNFIGIDPGGNGAAVLLYENKEVDIFRFKDKTYADIVECFEEWATGQELFAYLEKVHSMPKQGVSSTFKFGVHFGFLTGILITLRIPFEYVTPQKWQKFLGCQSKGDKNVTKAMAQRLFPNEKIVHGNADALLIAEYGRRTHV